jgi:hypothetical protein
LRALRGVAEFRPDAPVVAAPAWDFQPLFDGSDPENSGAYADAVTVHARKVALTSRRQLIGEIELRYSPRCHAAWGRFTGYPGLVKIALYRHKVDLVVGVTRGPPNPSRHTYETEYGFDASWGALVLTGEGPCHAWTEVYFDGQLTATGGTDDVPLP